MKVHFLGCGDAFGSGGRNQSAYLVEAPDRLFLLDCGSTTLVAMKRAGYDPGRLDAILLSHLHGDHCGGLPFIFLEYLYENPRERPLHVAGPPGTEERVRTLSQLMFGDGSVHRELPPTVFHILEPARRKTVEGIEIFPFRVPHQVADISLGLRIDYQGKRLLYSGDSGWTDLFLDQALGADLFICECCFFDRDTPNHMSYETIKKNLPRLRCKNLVLTHMGQEMLARKSELTVTTAEDGMIVEI
jgi:ribonuclease BN (tRNA processing enzyme)